MLRVRRLLFYVVSGIVFLMPRAAAQAPATATQAADPPDLVKQARKLNSEGNQDAALALYRQALGLAPDLFDAHFGAGVALDLKGDYKEARQHFAKAIELAPEENKNLALTAMGVSHAFEGNAKSSSTFYRQVFDRQMTAQDVAGAAETANALGRIYLESGDLDNAFKWYQTGYETSRRQTNLPGDQIDLWDLRWAHAQARIAARRGNAEEARKQIAIVKGLLDKGTNPEQRIQLPYLTGYVDLYLKDYSGALAELQKADQRDPFILALLAQAYEKSGDQAKAGECYQQVLASNSHGPNNAFARPLARRKVKISSTPRRPSA
jgi:tetratricopeptide (TPR) repeat protein